MTPEQLLIPRYLLIKDGWGLTKGEIVTEAVPKIGIYDQEPETFKPLKWWEYRLNEEMPQYVKLSIAGETMVFEVVEWHMEEQMGIIDREESLRCNLRYWNFEPSCKKEYQEFQRDYVPGYYRGNEFFPLKK